MSHALLRLLASEGLEPVPPAALEDLAKWCRARAEATGDGRYSVLGDAFDVMWSWWGDDENAGVAVSFLHRVNTVLKTELGAALDATDTDEACAIAATMRDQLVQIGLDAGSPMTPSWQNSDP